MKKYGIGLLAIVFAVAGLAFTNANTTSKAFADCTSSLIWYKVVALEGDQPASVGGTFDVTKLITNVYPNLGSENPAVVNATDFPAARLFTRTQYLAGGFGCVQTDDFVCALGFEADGTPDGEFEIVGGNIVPKKNGSNQSIPLIKCIVYRPTE